MMHAVSEQKAFIDLANILHSFIQVLVFYRRLGIIYFLFIRNRMF